MRQVLEEEFDVVVKKYEDLFYNQQEKISDNLDKSLKEYTVW